RFAQEVQLLARLRHPCIAQIYEAGSHDFGDGSRPWFAMEYINGPPITEFVRQHHLETAERLRLMISVCDAVQHAHQRGVIHRDLKPGNILVSDDAGVDLSDSTFQVDARLDSRPKVLDFGIARATDRELGHSTMHTQTGQLLGTLPYMSPEQVGDDSTDLDVRSDVYALGVILYEVLTDRLPYDVKDRPIASVARIIAEIEPPPLSSVDKSLRGDLEQIVRKSLAKDKRERYQSASALADDLLRFLNDEPILARAPSAWYQCRKFAKRNRMLVSSAVILLVVLIASSIISTSLYVRAEREARAKEDQIVETQWEAYIANIAAAHSAIREGRAADARHFLELAPVHRRGWEWRHLNGLLDRATLTIRGRAYIEDAIFSRDERAIITGDDDGHLHRYDAKTGELLSMHETAHGHWIHDLDLHPTLPRFAVASSDRMIGIYDAQTLELINRLGPMETPLRTVVWSRDGESIYCGLINGRILKLDPSDGRIEQALTGHEYIIEKLAISADGETLVSGSGDLTIRIWDTRTGLQRMQFKTDSGIYSVSLSPDDRLIACTTISGYVSVFDLEKAMRIAHWRGDLDRVISVAFSPDGSMLATGSQTSRLRLWETDSWRMVTELVGHSGPVRSLNYSADGKRLVSASNDETARIWDLYEIGVDVIHDHDAWVYGLQVSADGTRVASSAGHSPNADGTVRIFDLQDGTELHRLESDGRAGTIIFHIAANDDLSTIVSHFRSKIRLWRPASDALLEFDFEYNSLSSAMTSDGRTAAVTMWEAPRIQMFDLVTDERTNVLDAGDVLGAETGFSDVAFTPTDDRLVAVSSDAQKIVIWSWPEGRIERVHAVHDIPDDPVRHTIAFSSDGRSVAMAGKGRIDLFEFESWTFVASLPFTARSATPRFSPDGTRLFAGCYDGAIRIWDLPSRRLVGTLYVHPSDILDLDISADGTTIVTGATDTTIRVLRAPPGSASASLPE
ncbi:MAG: serine/threonine protein kinase, partial [Planctomycetota bacterium]|nr:serine/threonine protein kinase [Planctomycetota bacterium]